MNRDFEMQLGPTLYERIQSIPMSEAERLVAVNAMLNAQLLVDACVWLKSKAGQLAERVFLKPNAQH